MGGACLNTQLTSIESLRPILDASTAGGLPSAALAGGSGPTTSQLVPETTTGCCGGDEVCACG